MQLETGSATGNQALLILSSGCVMGFLAILVLLFI
jgi:hypothetical protein